MNALVLLLAVAAASPAQRPLTFPESLSPESLSSESLSLESLIDQLYGPLVDTAEARAHKQRMVSAGMLGEPIDPQHALLQFAEVTFSPDEPWMLAQQLQQAQAMQQHKARLASHQQYVRLRLRAHMPPDDDTSDLHGLNLFGGILTFGAFDTFDCYDPAHYDRPIDIAIVGAPFDTGTSFRPGARFGPEAIRLGARRLHGGVTPVRGNGRHTKLGRVDPYDPRSHNLSIVDCGDVPMTPFDNRVALNQLYRAQRAIHNHTSSARQPARIITMGGDHTVTLMALRAAYEQHGPLAVVHFDSHIDTWDPRVLGGGITDYMRLNHGTFLHYAAENGYLGDTNFHVGLRAPYIDAAYDVPHDKACGFTTITARELDTVGRAGIVAQIKRAVGDRPVYISVDIDVLDPANAPGTGTMEIGGWTGRELLSVLDDLEGLNVVGGDVVEVSPPFDTASEITALAATAVIDSMLGLMVAQSTP